jgi:hypothetical protein
MLDAVERGHGGMAQFDHPEFGGPGQWMRGGMTMVGRMFDDGLKGRVAALCEDLARLLQQRPLLSGDSAREHSRAHAGPEAGEWWTSSLGRPDATGGQNDMRYAYFSTPRRLAVQIHGRLTIYDTLDHQIFGVSQQQADGGTLRFTSQHGPVALESLPIVTGDIGALKLKNVEKSDPLEQGQTAKWTPSGETAGKEQDLLETIERLAALKAKGALTEAEFVAKKRELLDRL